jgi:hypothetical protein
MDGTVVGCVRLVAVFSEPSEFKMGRSGFSVVVV